MPLGIRGWTNRGWLEVISMILKKCNGGTRKTHVMYDANLNSDQVNEYLEFLANADMVNSKPEHQFSSRLIYTTTPKGMKFLERYNEMIKMFGEDKHE